MNPVEYVETRRSRGWKIAKTGLLFAMGVWMCFLPEADPMGKIAGAPMALLGGLGLWLLLASSVKWRQTLRLDAAGIHADVPGDDRFDLPWTALRSVRIERSESKRLVVLDLADPQDGLRDPKEGTRQHRRKTLAAVGSPFAVDPSPLGLSPEALRDEIDRRRSEFGVRA